MSGSLWVAYVATVLVLMATPGPSQLLMLGNSARHGFRPSLATAAGDLSANVLQMLAAGLGLATMVSTSKEAFVIIKWIGVLYLIWIALRQILHDGHSKARASAQGGLRRLFLQGFVSSAANPKAVVFFAALFPQFIDARAPLGPQLFILSATYVVIDATFLTSYGMAADWISKRMNERFRRWESKITGALLLVAAILLGLKDVEPRPADS